MTDIFFVLKSLAITVVILILMQIKIGDSTMETKFHHWVNSAAVVAPLQEAADGGVALVKQAWNKVSKSFTGKTFNFFKEENIPGKRVLGLKLQRSAEYIKEKAKLARIKAEEEAKEAASDLKDYMEEDEPQ